MQPVFRGTTPTIALLLSFDPRDAQVVWFTFAQKIDGEERSITKDIDQCELLEDRIRTRLTQEETLLFSCCERVRVQARIYMRDGTCVATSPYDVPIKGIIRDGVIGPDGSTPAPYLDDEVLLNATDLRISYDGTPGTWDHTALDNRDKPEQHPIDAITGLREALDNAGQHFTTDETLRLENGVLSVNTATAPEEDNTLPITSAAVAQTVGNIEIILQTI